MTLIKCPACTKDISEEANACPHCGHPVTESVKEKTVVMVCIANFFRVTKIVVFSLIIIFVIFAVADRYSPCPIDFEQVSLKCNLTWTPINSLGFWEESTMTLKNDDIFEWTNISLTINPQSRADDYNFIFKRLAADSSKTINLKEFSTKDGIRFNHKETMIKSISISADTPKGRGSFFGEATNE